MKRDQLLDYLSWTFLSLSLALLTFTARYVENIIRGKMFVLEYVLWGILIASLWMFILYRTYRSYFDGGQRRASAILSQYFSWVVLTLFLGAFYNYETGKKNTVVKKALVVRKSENVKTKTKYVHLIIGNNKRERFNPRSNEYRLMRANDSTLLLIGKGNLRYEFILAFGIGEDYQQSRQ